MREVRPAAGGTALAVASANADDCTAPSCLELLLIDLTSQPAAVLASHESRTGFGPTDAGAERPATRLGRVLTLRGGGEQLVLTELTDRSGEVVSACGWWLRAGGPMFLCAPRTIFASRYEARGTDLVERWPTDLPGATPSSTAGDPSAGWTGRVLRFSGRRWDEVGSFRCLARPLDDALADTRAESLSAWQRETVLNLVASARRESARLDSDVAISRLRDALDVDRCDAEVWRLMGRLQFESGRVQDAVPALALALALAPARDAALLDLADALAVLNATTPEGKRAWQHVRSTLLDRAATRGFVTESETEPRTAALALYVEWLRRTPADERLVAPIRRRALAQIAELERSGAKRSSATPARARTSAGMHP